MALARKVCVIRLILSVNDMSESKMKPRLRAEELNGMISLLLRKFEPLLFSLFCTNEKEFSFGWIEEQFVRVHPGE